MIIETPIPTTRNALTTTLQTIYTAPLDVAQTVVMNIHVSNSGGSAAPASLTLYFGGLKFYDSFPVSNTLDRDTYLLLGAGDTIEANANANNALNLFVTMVEQRYG